MQPVWWPGAAAALGVALACAAGCGTAPASPATAVSALVAQGRWQVEQIGGAGVADGSQVTVEFASAARAGGSTGCNRWSADYAGDADTLRFEQPIVTKRACAPALMRQESSFLALLAVPLRTVPQPDGAVALAAADGRSLRMRPAAR